MEGQKEWEGGSRGGMGVGTVEGRDGKEGERGRDRKSGWEGGGTERVGGRNRGEGEGTGMGKSGREGIEEGWEGGNRGGPESTLRGTERVGGRDIEAYPYSYCTIFST